MGLKKRLGFSQPKPRSKKEVDAEYTNHAVLAGHKSRILAQMSQDAAKIQAEVDAHVEKMLALNEEGMKLPPEPKQESTPPAPTPEVPT